MIAQGSERPRTRIGPRFSLIRNDSEEPPEQQQAPLRRVGAGPAEVYLTGQAFPVSFSRRACSASSEASEPSGAAGADGVDPSPSSSAAGALDEEEE